MNVIEAAAYLQDRMKNDPDIQMLVQVVLANRGWDDVQAFVDNDPEGVIMIAEGAKDLEEQDSEVNDLIDIRVEVGREREAQLIEDRRRRAAEAAE